MRSTKRHMSQFWSLLMSCCLFSLAACDQFSLITRPLDPVQTPSPAASATPDSGSSLGGPSAESSASPSLEPSPVSPAVARYQLVKRELEVTLAYYKPDGIHGGKPALPQVDYFGPPENFHYGTYDPLRGLDTMREGQVKFNWYYDANNEICFIAGWSLPPAVLTEGQRIPMTETMTVVSNSHGFASSGNINARIHFGGSDYYYLVTGDATEQDPNQVIKDTPGNASFRNDFDVPLKARGAKEFSLHVWAQYNGHVVGWWYRYERIN